MSYDLGHPADEGGGFPPYFCPLCGQWHTADSCPLDSDPAPVFDEGPDPDPGPPWEDLTGVGFSLIAWQAVHVLALE